MPYSSQNPNKWWASCLITGLIFLIVYSSTVSDSWADSSSSQVKELQKVLVELGYDPGPVDGLIGSSTRLAIRKFQSDKGKEVDGKFSGLLLLAAKISLAEKQRRESSAGQQEEATRQSMKAMSDKELLSYLTGLPKKSVEKIANLIPDRVKQLPAKEMGSLMFGDKVAEVMYFGIDISLRQLLYPTDEDGIRQFQSDIGADTTGILTFGQMQDLFRRNSRAKDSPVYSSSFAPLRISRFSGHIEVEGTWKIEGEQIAYPVNSSKIVCEKQKGFCLIASAELSIPSLEKDVEQYSLHISTSFYDIISWSSDEVIAQAKSDCRTVLLTINSSANEVFEVARNNDTGQCREQPFSLPSLDKPIVARLVPGFDATRAWWEQRQKETSLYINPRVRARVESQLKALRGK